MVLTHISAKISREKLQQIDNNYIAFLHKHKFYTYQPIKQANGTHIQWKAII